MLRSRVWSTFSIALVASLASASGAQAANHPAAHARLVAFDSCRSLVGYAHANAARAGGIGEPVRALGAGREEPARPVPATAKVPTAQPDAAAVPAPGAATTCSGTNVQEAHVDEPDVVKT